MLTFADKLAVIESFPELTRKDVSLGRVNFHYEDSAYDKKVIVYHLHPNGNGFVYAGHLDAYDTDDRGFVNIRDFSEDDLRSMIAASIRSLSVSSSESAAAPRETREVEQLEPEATQEVWHKGPNNTLRLTLEPEDNMWYLYSGDNLESVFETYAEAKEYLQEEGFINK